MRPFSLIIPVLVLGSCAQIRDPQGGPKDVAPPHLLSAEPANGSVLFSGRRIVLHFDERIKLDRVTERLLISPPLAKRPSVSVSGGNNVVIELNSPLLPNTTYSFQIGEAVADLTESNPATGLAYVVSTGTYLDSLTIKGSVEEAVTGAAAANVLVVLQAASDTSALLKTPPAYFARTDAQGLFALAHLRNGAFRIGALRDQNANYINDLPNEDIAFGDSTLASATPVAQHLFLFRPLPTEQQVLEAKVLPDRGWQLVMAKPSAGIVPRSLDLEGGTLTWWPEWNATRDTVVLWPSDTTLLADQRFAITENGAVVDTITYRPMGKMPFYATLALMKNGPSGAQRFIASRPVVGVNVQKARLLPDTVVTHFTAQLDSSAQRLVDLRLPSIGDPRTTLLLLPGLLNDRYGGTNDTVSVDLVRTTPDQLGQLHVRILPDSGLALTGPWLLQLLDQQGHTVRTAKAPELPISADWGDLVPGVHSLKLLQDMNGDGRWTTGSIADGLQPERIKNYAGTITVRAAWLVEVEWHLLR